MVIIQEINNWFCEICKHCISNDTLYWLYSTIAQALTAYIALIFTGYTLFYSILNNLEQQDETLIDIHRELKQKYFNNLLVLFIFSIISIFLSLYLILFIECSNELKCGFIFITIFLTSISFLLGFRFIYSALNPRKYHNIAKTLLKEIQKGKGEPDKTTRTDFIEQFIEIEKSINEFIDKHRNEIKIRDYYTQKFISIRKLIEALLYNELIDRKEYEKLVELNKIRNLIVHGQIDKVDKSFLDEIKNAKEIINNLEDRINKKTNDNATQQKI